MPESYKEEEVNGRGLHVFPTLPQAPSRLGVYVAVWPSYWWGLWLGEKGGRQQHARAPRANWHSRLYHLPLTHHLADLNPPAPTGFRVYIT